MFGSPGWVLGGALLLGALEHGAASDSRRKAAKKLEQATSIFNDARRKGEFVPTEAIQNIEEPVPALWFCERTKTSTRQGFFRSSTTTHAERLIHNGEPFIAVVDNRARQFAISWDKGNCSKTPGH